MTNGEWRRNNKQSSIQGLTGRIEFNEGKRSNFQIDLLKLKRERVEKVGYWSPDSGINITDTSAFYETNATNITLIVMTREVSGYGQQCTYIRACIRLELNGGVCRPVNKQPRNG